VFRHIVPTKGLEWTRYGGLASFLLFVRTFCLWNCWAHLCEIWLVSVYSGICQKKLILVLIGAVNAQPSFHFTWSRDPSSLICPNAVRRVMSWYWLLQEDAEIRFLMRSECVDPPPHTHTHTHSVRMEDVVRLVPYWKYNLLKTEYITERRQGKWYVLFCPECDIDLSFSSVPGRS
jgi:hypothetical protein